MIQYIRTAVDPEEDFDAFLTCARGAEMELCLLSGGFSAVDLMLLARFLHAHWEALFESLCGRMSDVEHERTQRAMNYRDDFLAWAEPQLRCVVEGGAPSLISRACSDEDFTRACSRKARIFDALVFLCAAVGFLSGMDTFSQTLRDAELRSFIGGAFFDELMTELPWPREEISSVVISAFSRLENSMNEIPLLEGGRALLSGFPRTLHSRVRRA